MNVDDNVLVLSSSVKEYKVLQLRYFFDDLKCAGKSVMDLLEVELKDNVKSIVTPPVLEKINDKYIIIDGSARFFYCMTKGITQIKSIVVDNVLDPLPYLDPKPLSTLRLTLLTKTFKQNYGDFDKSNFRLIEKICIHIVILNTSEIIHCNNVLLACGCSNTLLFCCFVVLLFCYSHANFYELIIAMN